MEGGPGKCNGRPWELMEGLGTYGRPWELMEGLGNVGEPEPRAEGPGTNGSGNRERKENSGNERLKEAPEITSGNRASTKIRRGTL